MPKHDGRCEMHMVCLCKDCAYWEREERDRGKCHRFVCFHPHKQFYCANGMTKQELKEYAPQERKMQMIAEQEEP